MQRARRQILLSALFYSLFVTVACDRKEADKQVDPDVAQPTEIKVDLPSPPNFAEGRSPEKWEDGVWSIYGLRRHLEDTIKLGESDQEVTVRGYVLDIYEPPECPEGQTCSAKQPHIWITDRPEEKGRKRAMMVVNYSLQIPDWDKKRWQDVPEVSFEKGNQYTFRGKFLRFSPSGFAAADGLLEFISYQVKNPDTGEIQWVAPPGASWHPLEVQRQEEAQKKLMERASKGKK